MLLKIFKWVMIVGLSIAVLGALVFVIAGLMPVKEMLPGESRSCYVPMEDGTRLAVWYNLPEEAVNGKKVPVIMENVRYVVKNERSLCLKALLNLGIAKEIPNTTTKTFLESNYAVVKVDMRGTGASFGDRKMEWSKQDTEDMGQVLDWISKQPWCNGKVGSYGVSYSGNTAELAVATNHPALKAAALLYSDFNSITQGIMPGGVLNEKLIKDWHEAMVKLDSNTEKNFFYKGVAAVDEDKGGRLLKKALKEHKTIDIYEAFKNKVYIDEQLTDEYSLESLNPYTYKAAIEASKIPLYVRVGWTDSGTVNGAIERFLTYSNNQFVEIGSWSHAGWHECDPFIGSTKSKQELEKQQAQAVVNFFSKYLKDGEKMSEPSKDHLIRYYTFGEGKWKTTDTWPVKGFENKLYYFSSNGMLKENKPEEEVGEDVYKVDMTATTGETNRWRTNLGGGAVFYPDRAEEDRKLLTYTSEPLENDVEITGLPVVTLNLSSNTTDGAFYTYLEDVAPDGKVTYITEGQLRALHRKISDTNLGFTSIGPSHSYSKEDSELIIPGQNIEMKIGMHSTSVLIKKGHKIRIAIAGHDASNFTGIPANENPIIRLQRNNILSSYVELPIKVR